MGESFRCIFLPLPAARALSPRPSTVLPRYRRRPSAPWLRSQKLVRGLGGSNRSGPEGQTGNGPCNMGPALKGGGGGRKSFPGPVPLGLDRGVEVFSFRDPGPGLAPRGSRCCFTSASSSQISPSSNSPSSRGEPRLSLPSIPPLSLSDSAFNFPSCFSLCDFNPRLGSGSRSASVHQLLLHRTRPTEREEEEKKTNASKSREITAFLQCEYQKKSVIAIFAWPEFRK